MGNLVKEVKYRVHTYETDAKANLGIVHLFNYLQDIAARHAVELHFGKEDLQKSNMFWVLSRIYCRMDHLPVWNDEIMVRTWPRGMDRLFALRDYEISDSSGNRIGGATSSWLMLNIESRRPVRPDHLVELLKGNPPLKPSLERNAAKLSPSAESKYQSQPLQVKFSDLDVNMHVNNVRYLQWAIDTYPLDFMIDKEARTVEINFLAETLPGEEVFVTATEEESGIFNHTVVSNNDNRDLCRLRIEWTG